MKRKIFIICAIILALIFIVPIPIDPSKDGGIKRYAALTYVVVEWPYISDEGAFYKTKVYFFPDNFTSLTELANREIDELESEYKK